MSRLFTVIRTLSAPACVFISRAFAAGDSYKDTNQGTRNEGTGRRKFLYLLGCEQKQRNREPVDRLVPESKEFSREGRGGGGIILLFGVVFRDFRCHKNNHNSQVDRVLILRIR